jgi:hypothetical protein
MVLSVPLPVSVAFVAVSFVFVSYFSLVPVPVFALRALADDFDPAFPPFATARRSHRQSAQAQSEHRCNRPETSHVAFSI